VATQTQTTAEFDRFEAYAETFFAARARVTLAAKGGFRSRVTQHRLVDANLRLAQASQDHLLRIEQPDRALFVTILGEGPPLTVDGLILRPGALAWMPSGAQILSQVPARVQTLSWSFDWKAFHASCRALHGLDLPEPSEVRAVRLPATLSEAALRGLLRLAGSLPVSQAPAIVEALLRLTLDSLTKGQNARIPQRGREARRVARDLVALADGLAGQPLPLTEVCARLGVPLRSLNAYSNEVLGLSAALYLRRRRLHAARGAMLEGRAESVTMAATQNGFWELGRFAGDYQEVFGELPSQTLRRSLAG